VILVSRFLKVQCECGEVSVVFGDSKKSVNCGSCGNPLVSSTGGHAKVLGKVVEVLS
jgi:ribosomal protein S27E